MVYIHFFSDFDHIHKVEAYATSKGQGHIIIYYQFSSILYDVLKTELFD